MPTSSSLGIMPGAPLARICSSTPGAILQPHPPPWLNWVSFTCMSIGCSSVGTWSLILTPALRQHFRHEPADRTRFRRGSEEAAPRRAGGAQARKVGRLLQSAHEQRRKAARIARLEIARVTRAEHADVARDTACEYRGPGGDRLDHHVRAAFHQRRMD